MHTERVHHDREYAESFGVVAEIYDRGRPGYAPALIQELAAAGPGSVLDVGCGTGKLAAAFMGSTRVLGLEPDRRMAAVASARGIEVELGHFEEWDPAGRRFDLVVSGTAWHWVDPQIGARKAAQVLAPGGRFVAIWNHWRHRHEVVELMLAAYRRHAPQLRSAVLGIERPVLADNDVRPAALAAEGFHGARPGVRETWSWRVEYTPDSRLELLSSMTDHRALDEPARAALFAQLRAELERLGPRFEVTMVTSAIIATRDRHA